ncbi:unnamed protein product [Trifolium pratense]|uniref:Uncharacterized protein n=1 Tax=Trifolium pratense TaxID=57577 RepID=A0ACB0K8C7_TRIPR|nr:unnamed protein product [Trifolium pratense]
MDSTCTSSLIAIGDIHSTEASGSQQLRCRDPKGCRVWGVYHPEFPNCLCSSSAISTACSINAVSLQ